ncbi:MAG: cation-transporting P-type ATPase [Deltaproteobacteria bacterium]|nr:cation-transporting P-type ATPase [Deltaproteobacteria bacterium]
MLTPVHTKVPGRARFRVEPLQGSAGLATALESLLAALPWVERATASGLTGTVLLEYPVGKDLREVSEALAEVVGEAQNLAQDVAQELARPPEPIAAGPAPGAAPPKPGTGPGKLDKLKNLWDRLLFQDPAQPQQPWHTLSQEEVVTRLLSDPAAGLAQGEAAERRKRQGPNLPPEIAPRSRWEILRGQFNSLPVALLGGAAVLSLATGGLLDAAIILGVVAANGVIGYFTESSAETTINSLQSLAKPHALVIREGRRTEIAAAELVAGDLLVLKQGLFVTADARVIAADNLTVDESTLTGESLPVEKSPETLTYDLTPLADRRNMVYQGTVATGGQGLAVVTATGARTELGRLQTLVQETAAPDTPIERQLGEIGDQLVLLSAAICSLVFGIGLWQGYGLLMMGRLAISLAAAAVPEGLPAAATTNLALGVSRMSREGVLIRNLAAVETLGAIQTICLDKTGTLTENRMKVLEAFVGGKRLTVSQGSLCEDGRIVAYREAKELKRALQVGVLCSETRLNGRVEDPAAPLKGTPTENALIELALLTGVNVKQVRQDHRLLAVTLRAEDRPYMTSLHQRRKGGTLLAVKGSPAAVLAHCAWRKRGKVETALTEADRAAILAENERMAGRALRVLGLAYTRTRGEETLSAASGLVWLGLVGMADPVRDRVAQAIAAFHRAGIRTVMLTGDQEATARSVAQSLAISGGRPLEVMDSSRLNGAEAAELDAGAGRVDVFSRVSPSSKLRIVQKLQAAGQVVAMTGDGVNDSPALKAAAVGIAMGGSGTDVAREVADVVLEHDDLGTLILAVRDGRTTYANIRKSVHFFLATNLSEILVMFSSLSLGLGTPLNTMQLLWINLISDIFPGLALSLEEPEEDVLGQPPRRAGAPLFNGRDYLGMAKEAGVITVGSLGAYAYGLVRYGLGPAASSVAFQSLTIGQLLHALTCRSERRHFWDPSLRPNPYLRWALGGSLALQALTMLVPGVRSLLGLTPLNLLDYLVIGASALFTLWGTEAVKTPPERETPRRKIPGRDAAASADHDAWPDPGLRLVVAECGPKG